jgi:hypothetical protein
MVGRVTPVRTEIYGTDGVQRTARPTARFNLSTLQRITRHAVLLVRSRSHVRDRSVSSAH